MSNSIPWLPNGPSTAPAEPGATHQEPGSGAQPYVALGYQDFPHAKPKASDSASVTALVFGLVGLVVPFVAPIVAIFLGIGAKRNIRASNGRLGGSGSANTAIILGVIMLSVNALVALAFSI